MKTKSVYEILKEVDSLPSEKEREECLRKHTTSNLKTILDYTFNSKLIFDLPEGRPPYTPLRLGSDSEGRFQAEAKKLHIFLKNSSSALSRFRRETIFIQILESIDPMDAELLCDIKDKKMPFKNVTKELVMKVYPTLIKEG